MYISKEEELPRDEVLYDRETVQRLAEKYASPAEIKHNVKTSATTYEIRTAVRYWCGGQASHRTSDRIWQKCRAVEEGKYVVENGELKYHDEVHTA